MGGGPEYVVQGGSRILNATRADQSGTDDANVVSWTKANDFIIAININSGGKETEAAQYLLRWRNKTDSGAFANVAATGAIHYNATTDLVNGAGIAVGGRKCDSQGNDTWQSGEEVEGASLSDSIDLPDEYETEIHFALDCSGATDAKEYEFELWDSTLGVTRGTCGATITMASGAVTKEFTVDGFLVNRLTKEFTINALLEKTDIKEFDIDGILVNKHTKEFTIDTILVKTKEFTIDAILESSWLYYKIVTIKGETGAGTNYQVPIEIGDSAGGDLHLEGHCTNFPQDIEVRDNDGETLLDFKIDNIAADPIKLWVEVIDDLGTDQDIQIHYSKSGKTTSSNGNDTFIEFDDISTESPEPWTEVDSSGRITIDRDTDERIEVNGMQRDEDVYIYQTKTTDSSVLYAKCYVDTVGGNSAFGGIVGISDTLDDSYSWLNGVSIHSYNEGGQPKLRAVGHSSGSKNYGTLISINIDTYYWLKLVIDGTTATIYVYSDATMDTLVGSNSVTIGDVSYSYIYGPISFNSGQSYASGLYYVDDIRVRKYNSPEPAFSSAGTEQSSGLCNFQINGLLVNRHTKEFTIDAITTGAKTKEFDVDSILIKVGSKEFDVDGILIPEIPVPLTSVYGNFCFGSLALGGGYRSGIIKKFTIDGLLVNRYIKEFSIDSILEKTDIKEFSINVILEGTNTKEFSIDGILVNRNDKDFTINGYLVNRLSKEFSIDSILFEVFTKEFSVNAILKATQIKEFNIDSILEKTNTKDFTVNGYLVNKFSKEFSIDASLVNKYDKDFTVDSILELTTEKTFTIDTILTGGTTKGFSINAILKATQTKSFTIDSILVNIRDKSFTVNGIIKKTGSKTFTTNAILEKINTKSFTIDSFLKSVNTKPFAINSIIKKIETKEFSINAFLINRLTKDFTIDSVLKIIATKEFTINGILEKTSIKEFTIDAITASAGKTKEFTIDSIIIKIGTKDFTCDTILEAMKYKLYGTLSDTRTIESVLSDKKPVATLSDSSQLVISLSNR